MKFEKEEMGCDWPEMEFRERAEGFRKAWEDFVKRVKQFVQD